MNIRKTLLSVLAVLFGLGLLAAIIIPMMGTTCDKGPHTKVSSDLRQVGMVLYLVKSETGEYPASLSVELMKQYIIDDSYIHELITENGFHYQQPPSDVDPAQLDEAGFVIIDYRSELGHWKVYPDATVEYQSE